MTMVQGPADAGEQTQTSRNNRGPRFRRGLWITLTVVLVFILGMAVSQAANKTPTPSASPAPVAAPASTSPPAAAAVAMPDYRGQTMQAAVNDLNTVGLGMHLQNPATANMLVGSQIPAPGTQISASTTGIQLFPTTPAPTSHKYTFRLQGTAKHATVTYSLNGSSAGGVDVGVPWSKDMASGADSYTSTSLSAYTPIGSSGGLTCSILDETGSVIATQTAESQGGQYGYAMVSCFGH